MPVDIWTIQYPLMDTNYVGHLVGVVSSILDLLTQHLPGATRRPLSGAFLLSDDFGLCLADMYLAGTGRNHQCSWIPPAIAPQWPVGPKNLSPSEYLNGRNVASLESMFLSMVGPWPRSLGHRASLIPCHWQLKLLCLQVIKTRTKLSLAVSPDTSQSPHTNWY